jgi:hypothetical protein
VAALDRNHRRTLTPTRADAVHTRLAPLSCRRAAGPFC